jgi:hypothetical protein
MSLVIHWFSLTVPCLFIITNEATTILTQGGLVSISLPLQKILYQFCFIAYLIGIFLPNFIGAELKSTKVIGEIKRKSDLSRLL